jgi:hypothetical protein
MEPKFPHFQLALTDDFFGLLDLLFLPAKR